MKEVTYTVHIEPGEEEGYIAYFPALPGCHTQGETVEEAISMAKEALAGHLELLLDQGKAIPKENTVSKLVGLDLPLSMSLAR